MQVFVMHISKLYLKGEAWAISLFLLGSLSLPHEEFSKRNTPGHLVGPSWQDISCNDPYILDYSNDASARWNYADADTLWDLIVSNWTTYTPALGEVPFTFPLFISNFLHGSDEITCSFKTNDPCGIPYPCEDYGNPAAYYIMQSLALIYNTMYTFYNNLGSVAGTSAPGIDEFTSAFAPTPVPEKSYFNLILDGVLIGLYFFVVIVLGAVSEGAVAAFGSVAFGIVQNWILTEAGTLSGTIKDLRAYFLQTNQLDVENTLDANMGSMINIWQAATDASNNATFNGTAESVQALTDLLKGGTVLLENPSLDDAQTAAYIRKGLYLYLIPEAWGLATVNNNPQYPFILDTGCTCDQQCFPGSPETEKVVRGCYNNQLYYVAAVAGPAWQHTGGVGGYINYLGFHLLPGIGSTGSYGGITMNDIISAAMATYVANNYQNGGPTADMSTFPEDYLSSRDITDIPGIVTIPVCTKELAYANWITPWLGDEPELNWPCSSSIPLFTSSFCQKFWGFNEVPDWSLCYNREDEWGCYPCPDNQQCEVFCGK